MALSQPDGRGRDGEHCGPSSAGYAPGWPPLPMGLASCEACSEPRGRGGSPTRSPATRPEVDITALCRRVPCAWCGQMPLRRPVSDRSGRTTMRYGTARPGPRRRARCRAGGAAAAPEGRCAGGLSSSSRHFLRRGPATIDYWRAAATACLRTVSRDWRPTCSEPRMGHPGAESIWRGRQEPSALISVSAAPIPAGMVGPLTGGW